MDELRELRKMPRGERCQVCGSRRWYIENGLRYCSNGDQIEGFVQFDIGDQIEAGQMGQTSRKEKEVREREKRHLTGQAGKSLYLEALQLILRNQLLFLMRQKGHREEVETVVRDLWELRIRGFESVKTEADAETSDELELFTVGPTTTRDHSDDDYQAESILKSKARAQSWDARRRGAWPMPRMIDTLALCYLGCLLLRQPTRIGALFGWVESGQMPYNRAYFDLPQEMRDRMPSAYTKALKMPMGHPLKGETLYDAVLELALSFHLNYGMRFPRNNEAVFITQLVQRIALPVHVVITARKILQLLDQSIEFPIQKSRKFVIDHPEILLAAAVVFATKLTLPFDGQSPLLALDHRFGCASFQWDRWFSLVAQPLMQEKTAKALPDFGKLKAEDVASMSQPELDAYFAHTASLIDNKNESVFAQFFPTEPQPAPEEPILELGAEELDDRMRRVLRAAFVTETRVQSERDDTEQSAYTLRKNLDDVSHIMKGFFAVVGDATGLRPETLVEAVYKLEQAAVAWQKKHHSTEQ